MVFIHVSLTGDELLADAVRQDSSGQTPLGSFRVKREHHLEMQAWINQVQAQHGPVALRRTAHAFDALYPDAVITVSEW